MVDIDEDIAVAEAEAEVLTGIAAMKTALTVGTVEGMMTGTSIMKVEAGGTGAQALATEEGEVEALVEDGIAALSGKAVRRDVPKLSSGTGKGNSKKKLIKEIQMVATMTRESTMMGLCKMVADIIVISCNRSKEAMNTDSFSSIRFVFSLLYVVWLGYLAFFFNQFSFRWGLPIQ